MSWIKIHGSVPYVEIMKLTSECDISIIVEGFKKKDVDTTRYSLSTKAADAIASGSNISYMDQRNVELLSIWKVQDAQWYVVIRMN